ncbi:MAG: alpha/beta fold hydrolase [Verrucomicrobiaceae bacterium]
MILEQTTVCHLGYHLHRLILRPEGTSKATLVFFHGQGDFIDRYPDTLEIFVEKGVTCILIDLPGHGQSPGKRGHIPGFPFVDSLLANTLENVSGPVGIAGHSMGGLLALRAYLQNPDHFAFAWFSSPILDPARQGTPWMRTILPLVARLFPWITWSTGVKAEQCRPVSNDTPSSEESLYHSKISLGWALDLINAANEVQQAFLSLPTDRPALFTQGGADPICPPELLRQQLDKLPSGKVTYCEIPDALHEPFNGDHRDQLRAALANWSF